ncbi:MAG: T9SS type A sorting domain-containing protein, partial [Saprospiraceae bacterium]|nr:T9SS type A sorting domain-containing protein [Saprospiraceae bacterium]
IYVWDKSGISTNSGVENLRIDIQTAGALDEEHARNGIRLIGVEDCWVKEVTALHFSYAAVETTIASRITILDCEGLQPHSPIEGGRRYNFVASRSSNNILFENCLATEGRHSFVSNGTSSVSGIVFYNCQSEKDYSASEGHRRWSQGLLFDNIIFSQSQTNTLVGLYNRGSFGTGHGWSAVSSVAWKVKVPLSRNIKLQKPPGRQNYAIACEALVTNVHNFAHPKGYEELTNETPAISSLYQQQLQTRLEKGTGPDGPAKLTATLTDEGVSLHWLDVASQEISYHVEVSMDGGASFEEIVALPADATSYLDTRITELLDMDLQYRVYAMGNACPSPYSNPSEVQLPTLFWEEHWIDNDYEFSGSGGSAVTVTRTGCEEALLRVTDPVAAPLPAFSPLIINPKDANGDDITDISSFPLQFNLRARSIAQVVIGVLFRSDDGTSDFRTSVLYDTIPANLEQWSEITLTFSADDIAGFNPGNLRDVWLYLDRGTENFSGNEFYIDYVSLGDSPSPNLASPCTLMDSPEEPLFAEYYQEENFQGISTTSTAGQATTFTLDSNCETLQLSVTDPLNTPLPSFNAYLINPTDADGMDIVDVGERVNLAMRIRSAEAIQVDVLFRSGEGTQDERSARKTLSVPGNLAEWTQLDFTFSPEEYEGFNPTDLRDVWFYLDRGTENFAGNEVYIDHIVVGGLPDSTRQSPCPLGESEDEPIFAEYFQGDSILSINTNSTAGQVTNFTLDTSCETLQISIDDPASAPLPAFNAYIVNPIDNEGNDITNIADQVNVSMRVRSAEAIQVDVLFRSGGGSQEERSARKTVAIPGNLLEWTDVYIEFDASEFEGFDPADLRDFWFYLDRGTPNFSGNEFYIDHITIGGTADPTRNSPCSNETQAQTWIENWDDDTPVMLGGSETVKLKLTPTECEELKIEVTDPNGNPHSEFRPIVINPLNPGGGEITNISGNVQLIIRARSAEEVPIGVLFRSGDGSADFRTPIQTQNVAGTLEAWSILVFEFTGDDLGGFDPDDLVDFWVFLDRPNGNFPGNELYIDYIAIGVQPDTSLNSPCGLPDFVVSSKEVLKAPRFKVYPNPVSNEINISFEQDFKLGNTSMLRLLGITGEIQMQRELLAGAKGISVDVSSLPKGVYFLEILTDSGRYTRSVIKL